ncbi:EAL domain-containing protein [Paraburkholderia phenazinium]|uniref:cyclic-guanylate-specific phosphodiesterase n=1 Tax=Paraburkholderia phenazinium TaxID=60549 RepID=A0A1G8J0Y4_9BURK|nr:cyclic diguanylate phosphodiesterase [Paraburkholderia phenazinium]SDI24743.1 EAL domain, c-di-GMP-specific phosphodiesterase class I (or its enzymatically inactive variant) [Paraburkholderia phenazinium]
MYDSSNTAGKTSIAEASASPPVWRGIAPRLWQIVAIACGLSVMLAMLMAGDHYATRAVAARERLIGSDLAASVDTILSGVSSRRVADLSALAGQPCAQVEHQLSALQTYVSYVRAITLVRNGRVYCSSGLGPIDVPLSTYRAQPGVPVSIKLLAETQFQPGVPVIAMFHATGQDTGVLYIIEGGYIADTLAHGVRYGAQQTALSIAGSGSLTDHGVFVPAAQDTQLNATRVESSIWPFAIELSASPAFSMQMRWQYGLLFGAAGLLLGALIAALYLLVLAPRRLLLSAVRRGLKQGELHVVYQPIVEITTRRVAGVEALLRWNHPKWGAVNPAVFMAEVETSALLAEVTRFILRTATVEMSASPPALPLRIAINIAPRDLERRGFVAEVLAVVDALPEGVSLVLELTERFLLSKSPRVVAIFETLKARGVRFAIDDFGTQHSNLDLLSRFPFDYVKIDRQFVAQVDMGGADLIRGIVAVAGHFDLVVIAEGVETEAQHRALRDAGVPFGQGYLYQRPLRATELAQKQVTAHYAHH